MNNAHQLQRLLDLGIGDLAGIGDDDLRAHARKLPELPGAVLAVHPQVLPASRLATLLTHHDKPGFVVTDMSDLDEFVPIDAVTVPDAPLYLLEDINRGDDMRNLSPDEALPAIGALNRSPLTISEGISWLLQDPKVLESNHCFMTIASRKRKGSRLDARTPAIWISAGTGRDGKANKLAPKVGWCWAGNRHTWLGFASTSRRTA